MHERSNDHNVFTAQSLLINLRMIEGAPATVQVRESSKTGGKVDHIRVSLESISHSTH